MSAPERDWVRIVAEQRCEECGLRASSIPRRELGRAIQLQAELWASLLHVAGGASLRRRAIPGRWSALEYGAHVRYVLVVFSHRIADAAMGTNPDFGWWDHEAAAVADRYNEQDPCSVAAELEAAAELLVGIIARLDSPCWEYTATRRGSELFSVDGLVRFALHEAHHHRVDAEASLGPGAGARPE